MTMGGGANPFEGIGAMENDLTEPDEDILTFDVPDDAIERAADGPAVTIGYCTCNWPLRPGSSR
jgi:hypothetical protein